MNVLTIARFTVQEAVSRRLVLAGVLISFLYVGLFALGFAFLYGVVSNDAANPTSRLTPAFAAANLTLVGLYSVNFLASLLALFISVGAISGEIDAGTLHAVLARPLSRAEFVLGRWIAYVGMMALYILLMAGLLLLLAYRISGYAPPDPPRALALMMLSATVLLTLSLLGSSLLPTLANGVVLFTLFGLAWLANVIEFIGRLLPNQGMVNLGIAVSLLVPSEAIWRGASSYLLPATIASLIGPAAPFSSSAPPTPAFLAWCGLHVAACLCASLVTFSRRDL